MIVSKLTDMPTRTKFVFYTTQDEPAWSVHAWNDDGRFRLSDRAEKLRTQNARWLKTILQKKRERAEVVDFMRTTKRFRPQLMKLSAIEYDCESGNVQMIYSSELDFMIQEPPFRDMIEVLPWESALVSIRKNVNSLWFPTRQAPRWVLYNTLIQANCNANGDILAFVSRVSHFVQRLQRYCARELGHESEFVPSYKLFIRGRRECMDVGISDDADVESTHMYGGTGTVVLRPIRAQWKPQKKSIKIQWAFEEVIIDDEQIQEILFD